MQQVTADTILVTPTGGTQGTLAASLALTTGSGGINASATPFAVTGLAAAQGGTVNVVGGASSTSANAGGPVAVTGGAGGATAIGGAVSMTGAAGRGGAAGGAASLTAGAGQGTGAGAITAVTGGASGAGLTGNGGAVRAIGGAALSTNGSGGNVVATGGASTGTGAGSSILLTPGAVSTGAAGGVFSRGVQIVKQGTPAALTTSATLTAAQVLTGILTSSQGASGAPAYQLPTGTDLQAALPGDLANDDAFIFSLINISTDAAEDASITTNTGWTLVGSMAVQSNDAITSKSAGRFMARRTSSNNFTLYRIS